MLTGEAIKITDKAIINNRATTRDCPYGKPNAWCEKQNGENNVQGRSYVCPAGECIIKLY